MKIACPKCGRDFENCATSGAIACPECGAELAAESFGETERIEPGGARRQPPSASPAVRAHGKFAGYIIQDELGRGGMGVVYKAYDPDLKRVVALKVLLSAEHASPEEVERFFREASSAAQLKHPNIVPIHELKIHEGKCYYTMDYIEGEPLDAVIARERPPVRRSAELVRKVALAAEHAHSQGIVHRDLKPQNIIVARDGEPRVTDFGLAKQLPSRENQRAGQDLTRSGVALGTPAYMAPEQAGGHSRQVDARADVYALGCVLYELLAGRPPFVSDNPMEVLRLHTEADPPALSRVVAEVPRDLETICLKCLEKDPTRRYQTAAALAADLQRFLTDEPVLARRPSVTYLLAKRLKRHRVLLASLCGAAVVLAAITVPLVRQVSRERIRREQADQERERANQERERADRGKAQQAEAARRENYRLGLAAARQCVEFKDVAGADRNLLSCPPDLRGWEWGLLWHQAHQETLSLSNGAARSRCLAVSPDGSRLAFGNTAAEIEVRVLPSGRKLWSRAVGGGLCAVAFDAQGARLALTGFADRIVRIVRAADGREERQLPGHASWGSSLAFDGSGQLLASGSMGGGLKVWRLSDGQPLPMGPSAEDALLGAGAQFDHRVRVGAMAFSPDGKFLATCDESSCALRTLATGEARALFGDCQMGMVALGFSRLGMRLTGMDGSRRLVIWDAVDQKVGSAARLAADSNGRIEFAALGAIDRYLYYSDGPAIRVWDVAENRELRRLYGHTGSGVAAMAASADGSVLASLGDDGQVKVWEPFIGERVELAASKYAVQALAFRPDGSALASGGSSGGIAVWETRRWQSLLRLDGAPAGPWGLAFSPDGARLASGCSDKALRAWHIPSGRQTLSVGGNSAAVDAVAFDPSGSWLACGCADGSVRLWDSREETLRFELRKAENVSFRIPVGLAFSPDGKTLAAAGGGWWLDLWSPGDGRRLGRPGEGQGTVRGLRVPGENSVSAVVEGPRYVLELVHWRGGGPVRLSLAGHRTLVLAAAFSPDGRRLATGDQDGVVKIWDTEQGRELLGFKGAAGAVTALAFSPDGLRLAAGGYAGGVAVFNAAPWAAGSGGVPASGGPER